ncbi:18903_t:CDS:2, partial [Acaulospora morrowiae]
MSLSSTQQISSFNSNNYIQVKPNKMIRAELLRKDTVRQRNPQYVRTRPNKIVRTISSKPIVAPVRSVTDVSAASDKASTKTEKAPSVNAPTDNVKASSAVTVPDQAEKALARQVRYSTVIRSLVRGGSSNHQRPRQTLFRPRAKSNKYTRSDVDKKENKKEDSSSRQTPNPPFKTKL